MSVKESIKIKVFEVKTENFKTKQGNLFQMNVFEELFGKLSQTIDNKDVSERRVLDTHYNKETSIWFDSFDNQEICKSKDYICFLMAKDVNYMLTEDSEKNEIKHIKSDKIKPKVPAHCVYVKSENLLLIEQIANSPTEATLKRGISNKLDLSKENLEFQAIYRKNILERLNQFVSTISNIEIDMSPELIKYADVINDNDGYLQNFISNPNTKIKLSLDLKSEDLKEKVVAFFSNILKGGKMRELIQNIKISHLNEKEEKEITKLVDNLLYLSLERELEHQEILETEDRLEYSKSIYSAIVKSYETDYLEN